MPKPVPSRYFVTICLSVRRCFIGTLPRHFYGCSRIRRERVEG
jgi:hypothetical protein